MSHEEQMDIRRISNYKNRLFEAKKLILILDLDHTLLHSVSYDQVDNNIDAVLTNKEVMIRSEADRDLYRLGNNLNRWTKIRPGVREFLYKASRHFELHVNTMGGCSYATRTVQLLDPTGSLFGGRIVYKKNSEQEIKSLDAVMGLQSVMVIVDDTEEVWPENVENLIKVEKYKYFKHKTGHIYTSLRSQSKDKRERKGFASLISLLELIHRNFFALPELHRADVRSVIAAAADTFIEE